MNLQPILSVGIDVGTTSTHLTLSRLTLSNTSRPNEPSRIVIEQREIVYQSRIYFTPLVADGTIDAQGVVNILKSEYSIAGIVADDVATGAVIITGETALKRNASAIVQLLSQLAGNFVVASAGPNMESVLAGRGSGAAQYSKSRHLRVCNVDIGGGTTNIAVFDHGEPAKTECLTLGGRFLQLGSDWGVLNCTESGQAVCLSVLGSPLKAGTKLDVDTARKLCRHVASKIVMAIDACGPFNQLWFSGGVAELMQLQQSINDIEYGDVGVLLAQALVEQCRQDRVEFTLPEMPIRATVIGVGSHSLQLSGSTVAVSASTLPLLNLPIIRPFHNGSTNDDSKSDSQLRGGIAGKVRQCLQVQDLVWSAQPLALLLPELKRMGYSDLQEWSKALSDVFTELSGHQPFVVICAHDIAAALGQMLRQRLPGIDCIVLDGIASTTGDYIDIGELLPNKQSIPVVIKDFVFAN